ADLVAAREGVLLADAGEVRDPRLPPAGAVLRARVPVDARRLRARLRRARLSHRRLPGERRHRGADRAPAHLRLAIHAVRDVVRHGVEQGPPLVAAREAALLARSFGPAL